MDLIKQALQRLTGGQELSPLPQFTTNVTQAESDAAQNKEAQRILAEVKKRKPNTGLSDRYILEQARKHGDRLIEGMEMASPTPTAQPRQNPIGQALQQILGAKTAQAQEAPVSINEDVEGFLEQSVFPVTDKYGIPRPVAAGQFAGEGRLGGKGASRNNHFNYMAYDGKEDQMPSFATPQEGTEAYAKTIAQDPRYSKAMQVRKDPAKMIAEIKRAGYATRPDYSEFVQSTPEFQYYLKKAASKL